MRPRYTRSASPSGQQEGVERGNSLSSWMLLAALEEDVLLTSEQAAGRRGGPRQARAQKCGTLGEFLLSHVPQIGVGTADAVRVAEGHLQVARALSAAEQQPPLIQKAFAQLEVKRARRKIAGRTTPI